MLRYSVVLVAIGMGALATASAAPKSELVKVVAFPVHDLPVFRVTKEGARFDARLLIEFVEAAVEPQSWASRGGEGQIIAHDKKMSITISQTDQNLERIGELLRKMRGDEEKPVYGVAIE